MEVDHILCICPLHRNGKGFKGVEGEGHQTAHCVADGAAQQACLDLKLEQARVTCIEPRERGGTGVRTWSVRHIHVFHMPLPQGHDCARREPHSD